jgi:hypothetical protein
MARTKYKPPTVPTKPPRYPALPVGTLVKPGISFLAYHWLKVVEDGGGDREHRITIGRTEPEREFETYQIRRDRITTKQEFDARRGR